MFKSVLKQVMYLLAICTMFTCIAFLERSMPKPEVHRPESPSDHSLQRAATHGITYYDVHDTKADTMGRCTGTAVGPHALLTGAHCNEFGAWRFIRLDYSQRYYHILAIVTDERDHDIYVLDGPAFTKFIEVKTRNVRMGETVTSYGTGGNDWPPHTNYGTVSIDDNGGDDSDVDQHDRAFCLHLSVVPGDSGSAVYGRDGSLLGLVSYGGTTNEGVLESVGFSMNFGQEIYQKARDTKETMNNGDDTSPTADTK